MAINFFHSKYVYSLSLQLSNSTYFLTLYIIHGVYLLNALSLSWTQTDLCYLSHLISVLSDYPPQIKARSNSDCCTFEMKSEITMLSSALIVVGSVQQIYREQESHTSCLTSCLTSWTLHRLSLASIPPVYSWCVSRTYIWLKRCINYWANAVQLLTKVHHLWFNDLYY